MFKQLRRMTAGILAASVLMVTTQAQQPARDWFAWLFNPADGTITQVSSGGQPTETIYLPLAQAFNAYGNTVSVSFGGRYVAYTAFDSTLGPQISNRQYFVYDRAIDTTRFSYPLEGVTALDLEIRASPHAFDEKRQQMAFGYATADGWQVVAASLINGAVLNTLSAADAVGVVDTGGVPIVLYFDANVAYFTLVNNGAVSGLYAWDIVNDSLSVSNAVYSLHSDLLTQTGEVLRPAGDAIQVFTPRDGMFTFYQHSAVVRAAYFIADGLQVLAQTSKDGQDALLVLNRDGTTANAILGALTDIHGTPSGFAGMFAANGASALARVDTVGADFSLQTVWSGAAGMQLVHIFPVGGSAPVGLPEWARAE